MTPPTPRPRRISRRQSRAIAADLAVASRRSGQRRPRRGLAAFAAVAALGLIGGSIVTTSATVAQAEQPAAGTSAFQAAAGSAQTYVSAADLAPAGTLAFGNYGVYVTPKPTPTPTPVVAPVSGGSAPQEASNFALPFVAPDPGSAQGAAYAQMAGYGWGDDQFGCLVALWNRESGWRYNAYNPSSGAYGIPQSLPGNKMATFGADWQTNPATQIAWGLNYIAGRYGTPCGAWGHSESVGWY